MIEEVALTHIKDHYNQEEGNIREILWETDQREMHSEKKGFSQEQKDQSELSHALSEFILFVEN